MIFRCNSIKIGTIIFAIERTSGMKLAIMLNYWSDNMSAKVKEYLQVSITV